MGKTPTSAARSRAGVLPAFAPAGNNSGPQETVQQAEQQGPLSPNTQRLNVGKAEKNPNFCIELSVQEDLPMAAALHNGVF